MAIKLGSLRFQIFKSFNVLKMRRQWYWRLKAANGEIIAQSEGYQNLVDCRNTIDVIVEQVPNARVEIL